MNNWRKLNHLVPSPQCKTKNGEIIGWMDERTQPTQEEIDAVQESDVIASELEREAIAEIESTKLLKLIFNINFDQENRLRITEGNPTITKDQYRSALIAEYKTI